MYINMADVPKLCRWPFLTARGGAGGRGGRGGGILLDSSVEGERAGGAGGGANLPAPVNQSDKSNPKAVFNVSCS